MPARDLHRQRVQSQVGISIANGEVGEAAGARVVFTVSLSEPAAKRITLDWATSDAMAQAGSDYQTTTGRITEPTRCRRH